MNFRSLMTLILLFLLPFLFGIGCEEETTAPESNPVPVITDWQIPVNMVYNYARGYRLVVQVEDAQGPANVPVVLGTILNNGSTIDTFSLWDDGSFYTVPAQPPWADSISGDLVPRDGFFSRRITGQFVNQPTHITFRFEVSDLDGHIGTPVEVPVEIRSNSFPSLQNPQLPDSLLSGFNDIVLSVTATDSDAQDSVIRVWLEVQGSDKGEIDLTGPDQNHHWSITIDSSFAAGIQGTYPFQFYAEDTFQEITGPVGQNVYVENVPPVLDSLVMPDTMFLPTTPGDCDTADIFLWVSDRQSLLDIYSVTFTTVLNDTGQVHGPYGLSDDGTGADQTAGDGIYSQGIVLCHENTPGKYDFTFVAEDLVGQQSTPIVHTLWVIASVTTPPLIPPRIAGGKSTAPPLSPHGVLKSPAVVVGDISRNGPNCNPFQAERRQP
jgi:hypothetical protein